MAISAFIGLFFYLILLILMVYKNFITTRFELRDQNLQRVFYESINDKTNPPFFPALCICILSIATGIMYVSFRRGLVFNVIQQACFVFWEVALFNRILYILDPFNRVVQHSSLTLGSKILHIVLPLICLIDITLYLSGNSSIRGDFTTSNLYFVLVSLFLLVVGIITAKFLIKIYFTCLRGLQSSQTESSTSFIYKFLSRRKTASSKIDVIQLNPQIDLGCIKSLTLESLIIERLLGFCLLSSLMNFYKLVWAASLTNCYFRAGCTTNIQQGDVADTFNSFSYWVPDSLVFLYWAVFLLNPLNIHLTSSARKAPSISSHPGSLIQREVTDLRKSMVVMNSNPLVDEEKIEDAESHIRNDKSLTEDHSKQDADINPTVPMDQYDQKRLSRPSQTSLPVGWLSQLNSETELDTAPTFSYSNMKEYRELHITLSEMVLIDKRIGIPVPTLFAGRDSFVVMSVQGLEYLDKVTALKRRSRQSNSLVGDQSPLASVQGEWVEISRSDCRINESSPNFIVSFIIPTVDSIKASARIKWRFDIYNAASVDAAFRVDTAVLAEQKLVGVAYVTNPEFDGQMNRQSRSSLFQPDDDEINQELISDNSHFSRYSVVSKHISVMEFDSNFVRLGGKLRISSCVVRPYSFVIAEISGINMMLHLRKRRSLEMNLHEEKKSFSDSVTQEILGKDSVMRSFVITKDECVQTKKRTQRSQEIRVGEELIESPYSFLVPIAFLKFLLIDRAYEYEVLRNRFSIPDVDSNYSGDDWKQSIAAVVKRDLENIQQSVTAYENTSLTFKSSSKKSDHSLRYIPINLHLHIFKMTGEVSSKRKQQDSLSSTRSISSPSPSPSSHSSSSIAKYTCDFMTVGAFAAHSMKYKSGGLWHMMKMFDEKLSKQTKGLIPVLKDDFRLPDEVWNRVSITQLPLDSKIFYMAYSARQRFDVCLSQCLAAVVTGFVSRLRLMSPSAMERMALLGLLIQFESLLSTQGSEMGMLADMYCTIKSLCRVRLKVHEEVSTTRQSMSQTSMGPEASINIYWSDGAESEDEALIVDMGFGSEWFDQLPQIIQDGKTIQLIPIFFSVGINELQSYAETIAGKKASELQDIINLENFERMEKYCSLVAALENGEFDRQQKDSDCTSTGDRMQSQNSTESCKFPFSLPSLETKSSLLSVTPKSRDARFDSSSTDEPDDNDKHKSFTRRKTAVLATDTASLLLLNPKKSRLHSIVVPNSFEHQFLANSHETKTTTRRVVPRQTSLAKIWDTVDSDDEDEEQQQTTQQEMKKNENEIEVEDEAYRRSIALCQEVSLETDSYVPSSFANNFDSSTRVQNPMISPRGAGNGGSGVGLSHSSSNTSLSKINLEQKQEEAEDDNEEEEDEIRAIRIEEAIWNKLHPPSHRARNRKESIVQYVDRMLSSSSSSHPQSHPHHSTASSSSTSFTRTHPANKNQKDDRFEREKSLSVFSMESEFDVLASESRATNGRALSTSSGFSHWLGKSSRGSCRQDNTADKGADPDLEMGDIGIPRESLSYLSDCLYSQDDEQNKDTAPRDPKEFLKRIDSLLKVLRQHVMSSIGNGGKPYHILTTSAKLTRLLDGVRSTSCKSAKDRTGMSVTLEEVTLVRDIFGINDHISQNLLDILRIHGVRLENAKKNIGKPRFAFNRVQRRFLPPVYAPPISVIGSVSS